MSVQNKPDYKIFASGAKPGEVVSFPDIIRGWGVTLDTTGGIPPMEFFNSSSMRINEWLMYLTQRGVPDWDASVDYPKSAMTMLGDVFYVSLKQTKGESPSTSQQSWKKFSDFFGIDGKLSKDQNGADIPDKPKFIENLGLGGAAKSNVTQTTGTSKTDVMSQDAVTDALNGKQASGNYADKSATVKQRFSDSIQCKYAVEITDVDGKVDIGLYSGNGKRTLTSGSAAINIPQKSGTMALNENLLGISQALTNVMQYRAPGVAYRNDIGRPITVAVSVVIPSTSVLSASTLYVDGIAHSSFAVSQSGFPVRSNVFAIIPPNSTYQLDNSAGISVLTWTELR